MYAFLCNDKGETLCGSDGVLVVDGRLSAKKRKEKASEYRERFKSHFRSKYDYWTHVFFAPNIRDAKPKNLMRL